jgi:hypothetical protein
MFMKVWKKKDHSYNDNGREGMVVFVTFLDPSPPYLFWVRLLFSSFPLCFDDVK